MEYFWKRIYKMEENFYEWDNVGFLYNLKLGNGYR